MKLIPFFPFKVCNYGKRFSPDNNRRGSGTESTSILSKSSREEGLGSEEDERDGDRGSDGLPRTPSVKGLVRRFSRRDRSPIRSPTFRSSNSIYDEYNGRGVTPRSTSTGIEVPFTFTTWHYRNGHRSSSSLSLSSLESDACTSFCTSPSPSYYRYSPSFDRCLSADDPRLYANPVNGLPKVRIVRVREFSIEHGINTHGSGSLSPLL